MPKNWFERLVYAFITVFITVHFFVWYCLSIEMGGMSMKVIEAGYSTSFWILPIPVVVLEIFIALFCAYFIGTPVAHIWASKKLDFKKATPFEIHNVMVSNTVTIMCPLMSFIAVILYNVIPVEHITFGEFICKYMQTVVQNYPFAYFSQMFFIQPFVGKVFRFLFKK
ncbi:MAG: DUF2798 domain-containing protein [Alphaproteobacteria bacterium]|nr:DUF2798 domain-containing protein [Alphaproteobacteria bacterium]